MQTQTLSVNKALEITNVCTHTVALNVEIASREVKSSL